MRKQMIVRVDPDLVKRLKVVAAHWNKSMAEVVREALDREISDQRKEAGVDQALKAAGL